MKTNKYDVCTVKGGKIFIVLFLTFLLGYFFSIIKINYYDVGVVKGQAHGKQTPLGTACVDSIIANGHPGIVDTLTIEGQYTLIFNCGILIEKIVE